MELPKLVQIAAAFNREGVEYILFGGVAVNLHGIVRVTEDYDFFVRGEPENVSRIKRALRSIWDDASLDEIKDDEMLGEYPSFRYGPPEEDFVIDVVSRLGEAFQYDDLEAEVLNVLGVPVRLATPETLYRMKRDTIRSKDRSELRHFVKSSV
jgi:hypothetical protein